MDTQILQKERTVCEISSSIRRNQTLMDTTALVMKVALTHVIH